MCPIAEKLAEINLNKADFEKLDLAGQGNEQQNLIAPGEVKTLAEALANHTKLVEIDFSKNYLGTEAIKQLLPSFKKHPNLRVLNLAANKVNDVSAAEIASISTLKVLNLSGNYGQHHRGKVTFCIGEPALEKLSQHPELLCLKLGDVAMSDKAADHFLKNTKLIGLSFTDKSNSLSLPKKQALEKHIEENYKNYLRKCYLFIQQVIQIIRAHESQTATNFFTGLSSQSCLLILKFLGAELESNAHYLTKMVAQAWSTVQREQTNKIWTISDFKKYAAIARAVIPAAPENNAPYCHKVRLTCY